MHGLKPLMVYVFACCLLTFTCVMAHATTPPTVARVVPHQAAIQPVDITPAHVVLGQALRYYVDNSNSVQLADLIDSSSAVQWTPSTQAVPNFGFDVRSYWFDVTLKNNTALELNRLLELSYPLLDHVDVFVIAHDGLIKRINTGDSQPMRARAIHHRHFLVPLDFKPQQQLRVIMRIQTSGALQTPLDVWNLNAFFQHDQRTLAIQLSMLGILLGLGIYNLFLYFATKESSYIWYVLTIFSMSLMILSLYGLSAQFIFANLPELNNIVLLLAIAGSLFFSSVFTYIFLRIWRLNIIINIVFFTFILSSVLVVFLKWVIPYSILIRVLTLASVVEAVGAIIIGVYLWIKGNPLAKFYTIAWSAFLLSTIMLVLSKWGALPSNLLTDNALQVGYVAEGFLLSFALAYRMTIERRQRDEARQSILDMQQQANEILEIKVQERTIELERLNQSLQELSTHDGLTGAYNRIFFEQRIRAEYKRGSRGHHPIGLLMIDADYFKRINDQYGHLCGDECLKHMAKICEDTVNREGDFVARYGGEEFVVLLSSTSLTGASLIAEKIRQAIEHTPLLWQEHTLTLTVSIGVAAMHPMSDQDEKILISHADQACYAAKSSGRNAVYVYRYDDNSMVALHSVLKNRSAPIDLQAPDLFLFE